jgi:thiol-disulfide isomerase/thioredoxin
MVGKRNKNRKIFGACIISSLLLFSCTTLVAANVEEKNILDNYQSSEKMIGNEYKGYLRVYIVEEESRWKMDNKQRYHNALFDIAFNDQIFVRYLDTYEDVISWSGDIEENNVIVMAALFNPESFTNYADPPFNRPFNAHLVDAAAGATPGTTGSNTVNEDFTHTVFVEKGTATWCPACPGMARKLKSVYESGDYPFYYVSMVVDESNDANRRMDDYSLYWLPTAFYDGGEEVLIGGDITETVHRDTIEACGKRDVHELDLSLTVEWIGEGELEIIISITNNEELPNTAPDMPTIVGPSKAKTGEDIEFTITGSDPDGDDMYFILDWGDENDEVTIGPYPSNQDIKVTHNWAEDGVYVIRVKARDLDGAESDWNSLTVTTPKSIVISSRLIEFISNHIKLLSTLFEKLIGLIT